MPVSGIEPLTYWLRISCSTPELHRHPNDFSVNLDPKIRKKLLQESKTPFRGLRRVVWVALSASAGMGLLIMGIRSASGETVLMSDVAIQLIAFFAFSSFILLDRSKSP